MNQKLLLSAALTAALTGAMTAPMTHAGGKEKCYGISAVGGNDCANLAGTHSCAGQAKVANDPGEYKVVDKGTCIELGGFDKDAALKIIAEKSKG